MNIPTDVPSQPSEISSHNDNGDDYNDSVDISGDIHNLQINIFEKTHSAVKKLFFAFIFKSGVYWIVLWIVVYVINIS